MVFMVVLLLVVAILIGSGGGGSSYISGYPGCNSIDISSTSSNIIHTGNAIHYSNKVFSNCIMQKGLNTGNGYCIISNSSEVIN